MKIKESFITRLNVRNTSNTLYKEWWFIKAQLTVVTTIVSLKKERKIPLKKTTGSSSMIKMCFSLMLETSQQKHLVEMTQILTPEFNSFPMMPLCSKWYLLKAEQKQEMPTYLFMSANSSSTKLDLMNSLMITQQRYLSKVVSTLALANKWWLNVVCLTRILLRFKFYLKSRKKSRKRIEGFGSPSIFLTSRSSKGLMISLVSLIFVHLRSINWWDQVKWTKLGSQKWQFTNLS